MTKNAYIHIPFCKSKCNYCSFVSFSKLEMKEPYIKALISQIESEYKGEKIETLYFGGGTPSLLTIDEFKSVMELFNFNDKSEITVEVNPDSVELDYFSALKTLGINRISIGSQTFDDKILKIIGRRNNAEQIKSAVEMAKDAGFDNISLDLIYGLPEQDLSGFEADLTKAIDLNVQHISLYGLKIEEGCYFYKNPPKHLSANLDEQADMYLKAVEMLKKAGFEHYEISNFSLPGYNSKHNLNYWENNSYYGFGCAASGYINNNPSPPTPLPQGARVAIRYQNESGLNQYIKNPLKRILEQKLSQKEILEEAIFLGLRKVSGINIKEINQKFEIDFNQKFAKILDKYSRFFIRNSDNLALTTEGILISNEILSEFI